MSKSRILVRLLRMYFPRNWEFGSALSKLRNFGGVRTPQPPPPLGTPLLIPITSTVTNASNIVSFLLVNHEYQTLKVPEHDFPAILFQLHLRHLISPFSSTFHSRNSTVIVIYKEIKNNLDSTPSCPTRLNLNELLGIEGMLLKLSKLPHMFSIWWYWISTSKNFEISIKITSQKGVFYLGVHYNLFVRVVRCFQLHIL
jgi:hypothetical protein